MKVFIKNLKSLIKLLAKLILIKIFRITNFINLRL